MILRGKNFINSPYIPIELDEPTVFTDKFKFSLDAPLMTSAGIYDEEGVLVRTLWSAVPFEQGTHVEIWDGKDDLGVTVPTNKTYEPRVLDHNVQYEWAGVWGNTSDEQTGDTIHKPLDPVIAIRIMQHPNGRWVAMYASGYGEGGAAEGFFWLDDPQKRFNPIVIHGTNQNTDYIAFNSTKIFRAGSDPLDNGSETFIYATNKASDTILTFPAGVPAKMDWGITYESTIGYMREPATIQVNYPPDQNNQVFTINEPKEFKITSAVIRNTGQNFIKYLDVNKHFSKVGNTITISQDINNIPAGSIIDIEYARRTDISGIAANDSYIYLSRKLWGKISIINAVSGALIQDLTIDTPSAVTIIGTDLWYATANGTTVVKRPINSDGSLGTVTLTLNGFESVLDIAASGTNVTMIDGGNSQQLKTFNLNTGASVWTRGQLKGYLGVGNKEVFNDKWLFNKPTNNGDGLTAEHGSIAYEPDGSYWLCDPGNTRLLHFAADGTYITTIAHEIRSYDVKLNKNNDKLLMATYKVFEIDPTKPTKQGWKLKYNFQENGTGNLIVVQDFTTLSNGRMYGIQRSNAPGYPTVYVVELDPTKGTRVTKSTIAFGNTRMYENGDVKWTVDVEDGSPRGKQQFWKKSLTGFDSDGDPLWGPNVKEEEIVIAVTGPKASAPFSNDNSYRTTNGNLIAYEADISTRDAPNQFRLGGIKDGKYMWKSLRTVEANHRGNFPLNGEFDWANYDRLPDNRPAAGYYGSRVSVYGQHAVASAHGEFWRGGQLNEHVHYHQDGLLIGVTGTQKPGGDPRKAEAFMAGNAITPNLHYWAEDNTLNIIHGDESVHQGIHRIKIKNPNSIRIQTALPTNLPLKTLPGKDLLEGFKRSDVITGSANGWTIPTPHFNNSDDRFQVAAGSMTTDRYRLASVDLRFVFVMPSGSTRNVLRDLGTNTNVNSWNLKGLVEFLSNDRNDPAGYAGVVVEILDDAGLVLADFLYKRENIFERTTFRFNDTILKDLNENDPDPDKAYRDRVDMTTVGYYKNLEIGSNGNGIVATYGDFGTITVPFKDPNANWRNPKTLRIRFFTLGNIYTRAISFYKLRFFTT